MSGDHGRGGGGGLRNPVREELGHMDVPSGTLRVLLGAFRKRDVGEEEGPLQRQVDYTVGYRDYTWTKLLDDLKKSVCWGDAQEIRATLCKQLKVGLGTDLMVAAMGSADFELHVEVVDKDIDESHSREKMKNGDSQKVVCSSDEMKEDGDSDEDMGESDEDIGDADSDIIYLEGFRISDETESEDDDEELDDDEFEADNYNQSLEAGGAQEKRPEAKHTTRDIVDILDDDYELQVEYGFVTRWALLNTSLPYMSSRRFLAKLRYTCLSLGMTEFATRPIREFRETVDLVAIEKLLDVLEIELVLQIPPLPGYNDVKIEEMCEKLGIAYHSCYPVQWKGPLKSFARKIQYKVVKRLVRLRRLELPLVRDAPTIIFGADKVQGVCFEHIASVVASVDWPKFRKYLDVVSLQQYNEGIIQHLYDMMTHCFSSFYKKNKERPKKLIFFRNGLEEGDFDHICQQEINAIKRACASDDVLFTYVVVVHVLGPKPQSARFKYKFCCRHTTEQISNSVWYYVVRDDNHFPAGELQAPLTVLSYACSMFKPSRHRRKNPYMDSVVPAYYALQQAIEELKDSQKLGDENDYSS